MPSRIECFPCSLVRTLFFEALLLPHRAESTETTTVPLKKAWCVFLPFESVIVDAAKRARSNNHHTSISLYTLKQQHCLEALLLLFSRCYEQRE